VEGGSTRSRDLERQRRFLRDAARGHEPFVEHATWRLERGEEPFVGSCPRTGVGEHLADLLKQAADIGSTAAQADEALDREQLSDVDRQRTRAALTVAAHRAARAHETLTGALRALDTSTRPAASSATIMRDPRAGDAQVVRIVSDVLPNGAGGLA